MSNKTTLHLTQGSVWTLRQILGIPGVVKTVDEFYLVGQVLCDVLPSLTPPKDTAAQDTWAIEAISIEITEKQKKAAGSALTAAIKDGRLAAHPDSFLLLSSFGLAPD
jgi:hypothetical protein